MVVLNVDDYEAGRYVVSRVLRQAGYAVMEAATGNEALALAQENPDLIVLDVNLPDVDGFEVCRRLKQHPETADIPVLYLSAAYRGAEHRVQGLELGADAYLTQPIEPRELVATANALLRARHVREAVRHSEERFRSLLTATTQAVWTTDPEGRIHDEAPSWQAFTGLSFEETRGDGWLQAIHPDDRERTLAVWKAAVASGGMYQVEHRVRRHDGEWRIMIGRGVPVLASDGSVREWVGAHTDVTEQRRSDSKLQRYAEQLRGLTDAATEITSAATLADVMQAITDQARRIIGAHQAVTSMTRGADWAQAINAVSLSDRYAGYRTYEGSPDGRGIYAEVCRRNEPMRMTQAELEAHPAWRGFSEHADRHPPMRGWLAAPLIGRDGGNLGLIQLSDRFEGEFTADDEVILVQLARIASVAIENARLYQEAAAANQAKSDFMAVTSHELRTPMNAILGYIELLEMGIGGPLTERQSQQVGRIGASARHLLTIIEEILTFSRIEAGREEVVFEPVDLIPLCRDTASILEPLAGEKQLRLVVDLPPGPVPVETDARKVRQILLNLLGNAIKFTSEGEVEMRLEEGVGEVLIHVRDTGIGIDAADQARVFEPFWQVDQASTRTTGGTGLGLSVTRELAQLLHGDVTVASTVGRGSTFTVRLPVGPAEGAVPEPPASATQAEPGAAGEAESV